jgi:hypothetical protein
MILLVYDHCAIDDFGDGLPGEYLGEIDEDEAGDDAYGDDGEGCALLIFGAGVLDVEPDDGQQQHHDSDIEDADEEIQDGELIGQGIYAQKIREDRDEEENDEDSQDEAETGDDAPACAQLPDADGFQDAGARSQEAEIGDDLVGKERAEEAAIEGLPGTLDEVFYIKEAIEGEEEGEEEECGAKGAAVHSGDPEGEKSVREEETRLQDLGVPCASIAREQDGQNGKEKNKGAGEKERPRGSHALGGARA